MSGCNNFPRHTPPRDVKVTSAAPGRNNYVLTEVQYRSSTDKPSQANRPSTLICFAPGIYAAIDNYLT
jgi:hypothetical protein